MKILIIEDEARAANHLERLITKVAPEMGILAKLESVRDSVEFLRSGNEPGLIFSDIQLADGLCFEIFNQVQIKCPIIFTTAWDHYAIEAFKTNGIDYLLKPVEEERLRKAIEKARQFSPVPMLEKILALAGAQPSKSYKSRFLVKVGEKIKTIPVEEIIAFYSLKKQPTCTRAQSVVIASILPSINWKTCSILKNSSVSAGNTWFHSAHAATSPRGQTAG
jgi:DNA-binding LytR/AlgR family response regulator